MTEGDSVRIDPTVLREMANNDDAVIEKLMTARDKSSDIAAALTSYGPIMHQTKAAVNEILASRDHGYAARIAAHDTAAQELRNHANGVAEVEEVNVQELRLT